MLPELQRNFIGHILGAVEGVAGQVAAAGPFTPAQRLQIYKNNTHLALTDILLQTFPAATKIVDEKFMRYAAQAFFTRQPPVSGDMNDYGADFPAFLKDFPPLAGHPYVADVARLEWLRHEAWLSPLLPAAEADAGALRLQPHVRLMQSPWPAADLWAFALEGGAAPKLEGGESFILIHRAGVQVVVRRLDRAFYQFLAEFPRADNRDFLTLCFQEKLFCKGET